MNVLELGNLPDWPVLMDEKVAVLYLCGRRKFFRTLLDLGLLDYTVEEYNTKLWSRADIDTAVRCYKAQRLAAVESQKAA